MTEPFRLDGVFSVLPTAFRDDGGLDLVGTASLVRAARDAGVAGLTVLGVMGEAAELPIVIQDYPAGSGVGVTAGEIAAVAAAQPLVVGVKAEAPPTSGAIATLRESNPGLGLVGGLGGLFLIDELRAGANGVMTGFALPERLVSIVGAFPTDPAAAEREWVDLLPLMRLEAFPPLSLAARKEVWRLRGVIGSSSCRRSGAWLDDRARDDDRRALARMGS